MMQSSSKNKITNSFCRELQNEISWQEYFENYSLAAVILVKSLISAKRS